MTLTENATPSLKRFARKDLNRFNLHHQNNLLTTTNCSVNSTTNDLFPHALHCFLAQLSTAPASRRSVAYLFPTTEFRFALSSSPALFQLLPKHSTKHFTSSIGIVLYSQIFLISYLAARWSRD